MDIDKRDELEELCKILGRGLLSEDVVSTKASNMLPDLIRAADEHDPGTISEILAVCPSVPALQGSPSMAAVEISKILGSEKVTGRDYRAMADALETCDDSPDNPFKGLGIHPETQRVLEGRARVIREFVDPNPQLSDRAKELVRYMIWTESGLWDRPCGSRLVMEERYYGVGVNTDGSSDIYEERFYYYAQLPTTQPPSENQFKPVLAAPSRKTPKDWSSWVRSLPRAHEGDGAIDAEFEDDLSTEGGAK